jgi:hypothetical protein
MSLASTAAELTILEYQERESHAVEPCDWAGAMKYDLQVDLPDPQEEFTLVHIFEVGDSESLVHTLLVQPGTDSINPRQVLTPGTEGNRCYRAVHEDIVGNQSASSTTECWE